MGKRLALVGFLFAVLTAEDCYTLEADTVVYCRSLVTARLDTLVLPAGTHVRVYQSDKSVYASLDDKERRLPGACELQLPLASAAHVALDAPTVTVTDTVVVEVPTNPTPLTEKVYALLLVMFGATVCAGFIIWLVRQKGNGNG